MERRLLEAARKGNIHELHELISGNELILEEMDLEESGHTSLHVARVAGHSDFVRELLKRMPKLAEKVNAGSFSPLHIAAAGGNVEIARELLTVGPHLCSVKGRERRIPLHYAAIKGELDVMKLLLFASPESIEETTALEETALHLAVKNNRFDAVVVLVDHLKQQRKEQVINRKDHKGNTALHLAAGGKNFEAVKFLLYGRTVKSKVVEVNALNDRGSTPLDVSTLSRKIKLAASRPVSGNDDDIEGGNSHQSGGEPVTNAPRSSSHLTPKKSNKDVGESSKIEVLLVIAALIANATYQSVIQPPTIAEHVGHDMANNPSGESVDNTSHGFVLQPLSIVDHDTANNTPGRSGNNTSPGSGDMRTKIRTINYSVSLVYILFLGGNTFGFLVSVQILTCLSEYLPVKKPTKLSLIAMVLTYFCYMLSSQLITSGGTDTVIVLHALPLIIAVFLLLMQNWLATVLDFFLK
ncbi:hypothetical protein BT93_E1290 [Corymbia citriodora subsp. variegata]|nr:hypothetical protein BT93_E1290 [Corymbia citriodora subsp. variegata]